MREGAKLAMIDFDQEKMSTTAEFIKSQVSNVTVLEYKLDLATEVDKFDSTFESISKDLGQVDVLVNNAGVLVAGNLGMIDPETYDHMMAVNVKAPLFMTQVL